MVFVIKKTKKTNKLCMISWAFQEEKEKPQGATDVMGCFECQHRPFAYSQGHLEWA